MSLPSRREILKLYKNLLRYGEQLKFTDKEYFVRRIKNEFIKNRHLTKEEEVNFKFEELFYCLKERYNRMLTRFRIVLMLSPRRYSIKKLIDYSKVPVLDETDLEEQQVRGSGPGGQKINKTSSCVVLKHIPTGIVVKCQESRSLEQNKKIARLNLISKLDNHINGKDSVEAQTKRIQEKKRSLQNQKKEKIRLMKEKWKEAENIE